MTDSRVREALERARQVVEEIMTSEIESYSTPEKTFREGSIKSSCGLRSYYNPDTISEVDALEAVAQSKTDIALIDEALAALASEPGVSERNQAFEEAAQVAESMTGRSRGQITKEVAVAIRALPRQQPAGEAGASTQSPANPSAMRDERSGTSGCEDCGRQYGDEHGFPDLIIPYGAWKQISTGGDDSGLLCPSCICKRLADKGIKCEAAFMSGPLSISRIEMQVLRRVENIELAIEGRDNQWAGIRALIDPAPTPVAHVDETCAGKEQKPSPSPQKPEG